MNKNNLERSVYEPVAIYNKITPDTLHLHMNQLLQINEPHHEMPKNKKKTADNTIRVSNDMRKVINSKAIATITKNNQNLWIGIGMSSVIRITGVTKSHITYSYYSYYHLALLD